MVGPDLPQVLAHVWQWFSELDRGRSGGFGPGALQWADIAAWQSMTANRPTHYELGLLLHLDRLYLASMTRRTEPKT